MTKNRLHRLTQATLSLLCRVVVWRWGSSIEGTEFSGGRLTGVLVDMEDIGVLLFVLAFVVAFRRLRIGAVVAVVASLLCLPLYLYFAAPGPFRWLFRGEYSVPLSAPFEWAPWTIFGIALLAATTFSSLKILLTREHSNPHT
jgi:hypothetical protein